MYGAGKTVLGGVTFANAERNRDCGYRSIQGTKPYTLAYGLSDSPVGLLGTVFLELVAILHTHV